MALKEAVFDLVQQEFKKAEPTWKTSALSADEYHFLEEECGTPSDFDSLQLRITMFHLYKSGSVPAEVRECEFGRIIAIRHSPDQEIPWGLWGRILRLYHGKNKAKVFFLASPSCRMLPKRKNVALGPAHINGGYTNSCDNQTIVIYRAEDATRVLLHELQHASCLDNHSLAVDLIEAETEAWAELLYVGLLSQGDKTRFYTLLKRQSEWMVGQNMAVTQREHSYPWRYTIGKEQVWRRWGIITDHTASHTSTGSLRLTAPPSMLIQKLFGVRSTIL